MALKGQTMPRDELSDAIYAFEQAVKNAAYSDSSPLYDPGNHYKHEEVDQARGELITCINRAIGEDAKRIDKLATMALRQKVSIVDTGVIPYRVCLNGQVLGNSLREVIDKAIES